MEKILISACLLGQPVRYNGSNKTIEHPFLKQWQQQGRLVSVCPEMAGGLLVPRSPAEIVDGGAGDVIDGTADVETNGGLIVTRAFMKGARYALKLCQQNDIKVAMLTESSPSCGSQLIYDGTFTGQKIAGEGVTSAFLERHGIKVFNQFQCPEANSFLRKLEAQTTP